MYAAGQTSEGVLANFFNSLLTKKAGTGGPGTPGGGNNTPGTVRKSGEDAHTAGQRLLPYFCLFSYVCVIGHKVISHHSNSFVPERIINSANLSVTLFISGFLFFCFMVFKLPPSATPPPFPLHMVKRLMTGG